MPFKKAKTKWSPDRDKYLIHCYIQAKRECPNEFWKRTLELFKHGSGNATATYSGIHARICRLQKISPEIFMSKENISQKKQFQWDSEKYHKLREIAVNVLSEQQLKELSGYFEINVVRGRKSNVFKVLHEKFLRDQQLSDSDLSVSAIYNAFRRALQQFGALEKPPVPTKAIIDDARSMHIIAKAFRIEQEFAVQPVFDCCCSYCGALLWGDVRGAHKRRHKARETEIPAVYEHISKRDLLPVETYGVLNKQRYFYYCTSCEKNTIGERMPDKFPWYNPNTQKLDRPEEIFPGGRNMNYLEKQAISLVRFSYHVAIRSKPWNHQYHINQGLVTYLPKSHDSYYHMYGFLVENPRKQRGENEHIDEKKIRKAIVFLRRNNPLFRDFLANFETLYRYTRNDRVINFYNVNRALPVDRKQWDLGKEDAVLKVIADDVVFDEADREKSIIAQQHNLAKCVMACVKHTYVQFYDRNKENKAFPSLYPYGTGGYWENSGIRRSEFIKNRILNIDNRFATDRIYQFNVLNEQARMVNYHLKKHHIASNKNRKEPLKANDVIPNFEVGIPLPNKIPGTLQYWKSVCLDLYALADFMNKKRPDRPYPDLFVTVTFNESVEEVQALIRGGVYAKPAIPNDPFERPLPRGGSAAINMPVYATVAAQKRILFILREAKRMKIFGEIEDYFIRAEYQNRGAIHWHMLFWCKAGTIPSDVVRATIPEGDDRESSKLKDLVISLQLHNCVSGKCISPKNRNCKLGFPFEPRTALGLEKGGKRYLYPRGEHDGRVVPYNAALLILAQSHVNCQLTTNKMYYAYLAQYVSKLKSERVKIPNAGQVDGQIMRLRDISTMECAHQLLQFRTIDCSREVISLDTELDPIYRMLKPDGAIWRIFKNNPLSTNIFYMTRVEHYLSRPEKLEDINLFEYYSYYRYTYNVNVKGNYGHEEGESKRVIIRRKKRAVVRWRLRPMVEDIEEYALQQLTLYVPFRKYEDLFTLSKNPNKDILLECIIRNKADPER